MKQYIAILLVLSVSLLFSGCQATEDASFDEKYIEFSLSENQLQNMCKLATLKCYYNNVAKTTLKGNFLQKDSKLWIEYSATVDMGIDFSKVKLDIEGDKLIITIPDAEILRISDPEIGDDSYYRSESGIFSAKIDAEDERDSFRDAQDNMMKVAKESSTLLDAAKKRAQMLIESYVHQMDEMAGTKHTVIWKDVA